MSKASSADSQFTAPTVQMSALSLVDCLEDASPTGSLSSGSNSNSNSSSSSLSGQYLSNAIESARTSLREYVAGQDSTETPFNFSPYVDQQVNTQNPVPEPREQEREAEQQTLNKPSELQHGKTSDELLSAQRSVNKQRLQDGTSRKKSKKKLHDKTNQKSKMVAQKKTTAAGISHGTEYTSLQPRTPKVTGACVPFEKTIPPTSCLQDELAKDPAYIHALKAGTLWQSLVGQHVKLPPLWFDGLEPARPFLGCEDPLKRNKWSYFGRHRVAGDPKLNALVRHGNSSGKLLLHIICRDSDTLTPTEDIVVGVFHPNAEAHDTSQAQRRHEDCRDVWIGHRSRTVPHQGRRIATRTESLLRYLHRNKVDASPLGGNAKQSIDNTNIAMVFGSRPPRHTLFVPEDVLYDLLQPPSPKAPAPPASVVLLRTFLR
mmetsp:Transcript_4427/g.11434  ORF Transcript_4427/g.11434 Transcript_4427/m.11434 type:complete len:431 (-) Transcript_4427:565-1857(-)